MSNTITKILSKLTSNLILDVRILGILSTLVAIASFIYMESFVRLFNSNIPHNAEDGIALFIYFADILIILSGVIGSFQIRQSPKGVALGQIICGIIAALFSLGFFVTLAAVVLLMISGILANIVYRRTPQKPSFVQKETAEIKKLMESKKYLEATPRLLRLSRSNPDDTEVKMLFNQWRELKNNWEKKSQ